MHSLLSRQVKRFFGSILAVPPQYRGFVDAVDAAYRQSDVDRCMMERSLELSSQELLQANSEMRSLFAAMDDVIIAFDARGRYLKIVETNPSLLFKPARELLGKTLHDILPKHKADVFVNHIGQALQTGRPEKLEYSILLRGDKVWFDGTISPLSENSVIWVARDITERKHTEALRVHLQSELRIQNEALEHSIAEMKLMQESLIQSEKMASVGLLTAGIAHEINNPLAFVSSNLNRFKEYFEDTTALLEVWKQIGENASAGISCTEGLNEVHSLEERIELAFIKEDFNNLMHHAREGVDRIKSIVERLRGFSHLSEPTRAEASINKALDDTISLAWNEIKYKANVRKEYGDLPPIVCNIGELKQVFVNLFINAAYALDKHGVITLRTSACDRYISIEIGDTGSGIPPENLHRIFDPFFTTKPVGKGTGLGLWISASIIKKHGGAITVQSRVGSGTTFTIKLPIQPNEKRGVGQ